MNKYLSISFFLSLLLHALILFSPLNLDNITGSKTLAPQSDLSPQVSIFLSPKKSNIKKVVEKIKKMPNSDSAQVPSKIAGSTDAKLIGKFKPEYPYRSRLLAETGEVVIKLTISSRGDVQAAQIISSGSHPRLAQAALKSIKNLKFIPAKTSGDPIASEKEMTVKYELK
jgi:TonB family protein